MALPGPAVRERLLLCLLLAFVLLVLLVGRHLVSALGRAGSTIVSPARAARTAVRDIVRPVPAAPSTLTSSPEEPEAAPERPEPLGVGLTVPPPVPEAPDTDSLVSPAESAPEAPDWPPSPSPVYEAVPPQPLRPLRLPTLPPVLREMVRGRQVVVRVAVDRYGQASFDSIESSAGLSTSVCKLLAREAFSAEWEPARDSAGEAVAGVARVVIRR